MKKLEIGTTVFVIPTGINNTRGITNIMEHVRETQITKIGRTYFYVKGFGEKFAISTLRHKSEHHYDMRAYLDMQQILDDIECKELCDKIRNAFEKPRFTLEQLRAVSKIIF